MLRDYQQRSLDMLYDWFANNPEGNPVLVLPTGSGKSHIIAAFCKNALQSWPSTRILMLTGQKELIEQNAAKLREHWPNAPLGIYSASVGKRQLGEPITFAGIQSVRAKADLLGHIDIVVVDECHTISHKDQGSYRTLLADLTGINPHIRIVGLTATNYRLGHGLITEGDDALFHASIEPVTIEELIFKGYLATLRSKHTALQYDLSAVHKRGGEYIEGELQKAVDTDDNNARVAEEVIALAGDRKHWLFFCSGVDHARHMADLLNQRGVKAGHIDGTFTKAQREAVLADFTSGRLQALCNCAVLTTGFDYPDIDLIAFLRPTMSASLYVQMAGRGMRLKSHTDHCLVLDFAGIVEKHGPITGVRPPNRKGKVAGEAPVKICKTCDEIVHMSVKICPTCQTPFPINEKPDPFKLRNDDIMGIESESIGVSAWHWRKHVSRSSGKEMLAVTYYGALSDPAVTEYLPITHDGYAGDMAVRKLLDIADKAGVSTNEEDLDRLADVLNVGTHPAAIDFKKDGKFYRVLGRQWA
ncbi:DEAD/DEAH box helicase [Sphingobium sp. EP60837]|uniref:DEAD/DEAH box helicase n=1 Tax=Sphingobium sp. EP60837 TaxID=1855519 RepID=UPI0007DCB8D7|nr:DEAD/DEAH box helicase [Sphingobium sp. EP60837]ANI79031.1 uncharacterized protein EP837_02636 [Sphingobium sp. EP60837]